MNGIVSSIDVRNEPVRSYLPGSRERLALSSALNEMAGACPELPHWINGKQVTTGTFEAAVCPHDHARLLARAHIGGHAEVASAIAAANRAWRHWSQSPWETRARVFLKAADLVSGPWRDRLNAATMLGQSKTVHQAEIDAAAELADFLRFNVSFMLRLYGEQPISSDGVWNTVDYRPLEGFVYAVTPFNFTAIAGNLPAAPALMGNTVVWKPSANAKLSAHVFMRLLVEAGLPEGVINLVYGNAATITNQILSDQGLAGIHFTGSTPIFNGIAQAVAARSYRNYPRLVGETGGKNFTLAHPSADIEALTTGILRGAFEYQGQKCSATSRIYVPRSLWPQLKERLVEEIKTIRMGDVADFSTFMGAVIDERAWSRLAAAQATARASSTETIIAGGTADRTTGYFVAPTLIETTNAASPFMRNEFFGPIATVFVYAESDFEEILATIDATSEYGLTGAIFGRDRAALALAAQQLRHAAGNLYLNDKSTGAVVGQQPFGGARASGTNDKAGSMWNLARWVSPRTIKECWVPPVDYRYGSMVE